MSPRWKWFLPGYLWALPSTMIGFAFALLYGAHSWRWHDGCLEALARSLPSDAAAMTHGFMVLYDDTHGEAYREHVGIRVHERAHVVQCFVGGPLFTLSYLLLSGLLWLVKGDAHSAYLANPYEAHARRVGATARGWGAPG